MGVDLNDKPSSTTGTRRRQRRKKTLGKNGYLSMILFYLASFLILPFGPPAHAIYMICKRKKYFHFISGKVAFAFATVINVVWFYPLICGNEQGLFDYENGRHFSVSEILAIYLMVLAPLIAAYSGMFVFWLKRKHGKVIGSIIIIISVIIFGWFLIMAMLNGVL